MGACAALCVGLALPAFAQTPVPAVSLPSASITYDTLTGTPDDAQLNQFSLLYGGELSVTAAHAQGSLTRQKFSITGGARVHERDTTLYADTLLYQAGRAEATHALVTQTPLTLQTPSFLFTPMLATADDVRLAAVPPGVRPDFYVRAGQVRLFPAQRKGELHNASVYLLGARLLTVRRIGFKTGGSGGGIGRRGAALPTAGVSARFGPFVGFTGALPAVRGGHLFVVLPTRQTLQLQATASQSLVRVPPAAFEAAPAPSSGSVFLDSVRLLATARKPPLPPGDPLLFRNILPSDGPIAIFSGPPVPSLSVSEDITLHREAQGRRRTDLYVSRLPEVGLNGSLPLLRPPAPTPFGDAQAFRAAKRHIVPIVSGGVRYARLREQRPGEMVSDVRASRMQSSVGLSLSPLLVARDTLLLPRATYTVNSYSKKPNSYQYTQFAVVVERDLSPYSALSVQYAAADTKGDSPFNFDVLDTTRELDTRLQLGGPRLTLAGEVRYDLRRGGVIEYRLAIAPGLRGLTPIFSYNSRTQTIGVTAQIAGVTF